MIHFWQLKTVESVIMKSDLPTRLTLFEGGEKL